MKCIISIHFQNRIYMSSTLNFLCKNQELGSIVVCRAQTTDLTKVNSQGGAEMQGSLKLFPCCDLYYNFSVFLIIICWTCLCMKYYLYKSNWLLNSYGTVKIIFVPVHLLLFILTESCKHCILIELYL